MIRRLAARLQGAARDDAGLTLIEITLYIVFAAIVGTLVVSLVISTVTGQKDVTSVTQASARGQAISQGLDRALRNAKGVEVSVDGAGNQVLTVLTTLSTPCQAWRITPGGTLEVSQTVGFASWGELAKDVEPIGTAPYFSWTGQRFRYSFALGTEGRPVNFSGAILPRGTSGTVGASCS